MRGYSKRLERLESKIDPMILLEVSLDGQHRQMTAAEYVKQPYPLDFRVVIGNNYVHAGIMQSYLIQQSVFKKKREPVMDPGGSVAMANVKHLLHTLLHPMPNRIVEDF